MKDMEIERSPLTSDQGVLGHHWLIELWGCPSSLLADSARVESIMCDSARAAHTKIIHAKFHQFSNQGISGFVVISESHLAVHTWPEHRYAAVDLFTCGSNEKMQLAYDFIVKEFIPAEHSKTVIIRGVKNSSVVNG